MSRLLLSVLEDRRFSVPATRISAETGRKGSGTSSVRGPFVDLSLARIVQGLILFPQRGNVCPEALLAMPDRVALQFYD